MLNLLEQQMEIFVIKKQLEDYFFTLVRIIKKFRMNLLFFNLSIKFLLNFAC